MTTDPFMYAAVNRFTKGYNFLLPTTFPCDISRATVLLYGTQSVVIGNKCTNTKPGQGVRNQRAELDLSDDAQTKRVIQEFIARQQEPGNEDTGE